VRITSPPFANPCFYGIDTPDRRDLIAHSKTVEEIRQAINADSLYFLSQPGLIEAIGGHEGELDRGLCLGCFSNDYPTRTDFEDAKIGCGCD
jgi:amidophosphoribosyltransferase